MQGLSENTSHRTPALIKSILGHINQTRTPSFKLQTEADERLEMHIPRLPTFISQLPITVLTEKDLKSHSKPSVSKAQEGAR